MALILHSYSPCFTQLRHVHLSSAVRSKLTTVRSQNQSSSDNCTAEDGEPAAQPKKPAASPSGLGFGSSPSPSTKSSLSSSADARKKKQRGGGGRIERASIIRRSPIEKPSFISKEDEKKLEEQRKNESAFLLAWLGLGGIILVEGIALAASGFLPEEWDKFFVKYLYPTFTPTVFLFVAGTVAYGVLKYLQNENLKDQK